MKISKTGLKLIKAFEGYNPVDRELVTGQRVVGYGHRLFSDQAMRLSKSEATELLKDDLAPFEDMLNRDVHAPLRQSQFDALCSFAYSIGPKAFLQSDVLRAINNGRPLDAANGFDVWRKSKIDGKIYVVDALMRRRAIEKALFLRTEHKQALAAPSVDLKPIPDNALALLSTEDALPVYTQTPENGIVSRAPYTRQSTETVNYGRRLEDQASGFLALTEVDLDEGGDVADTEPDMPYNLTMDDMIADSAKPETMDEETVSERTSTMIAKAASQLSDKLDALIDDNVKTERESDSDPNWPETLITAQTEKPEEPTRKAENVVSLHASNDVELRDNKAGNETSLVIDNLSEDDALREGRDSAAKYIEIYDPNSEKPPVGLGYWLTLLMGFIILGASVAAFFVVDETWLAGWAPLLTFIGLIVGGVLIISALYYAIKLSLQS